MGEIEVNQQVSKGVTGTVDNMVLQAIIKMVADYKLKNDQVLSFQLKTCPHCQKQFISVKNIETTADGEVEDMQCVFCEKPTDTTVIVYQFEESDTTKEISGTIQVICLGDEAKDLTEKYEARE